MMSYQKKLRTQSQTTSLLLTEKSRFVIIFFLFSFFFLVIFWRLLTIQVYSYEEYVDQAVRQHGARQHLIAKRGTIYLSDRDTLYPAAINREYYLAYVSPREISAEERADVTDVLVDVFQTEREDLVRKLDKTEDNYEVIQHKISIEDKERIEAKDIPGLHFLPEVARFYPGESIAANVIGFVGSDGTTYAGRYGIEAYFENELRGEHGWKQQETDARGGWLSVADRTVNPQKDGMSLRLTIDRTIQEEVEKILAEDVEKYNAEDGGVIVMNPHTGAIIALATTEKFSPNTYGSVEDISTYRNSMVSDVYEPGSVFKTITIAGGLDDGKIVPQSTYTDTGGIFIGGYTIKNSEDKVYGVQTMTQVLEESINTGVIHVGQLMGNAKFKEYTERFGFGSRTGITLPAEAAGNIRNLANTNRDIEYYTASFGQGLTATPLQLATAYSALANGGNLYKPQIVAEKIFPDGTTEKIKPQMVHRVVSNKVSDEISLMLEEVIAGGHAKLAAVPGYRVGGKTGTAQSVDTETGTYAEDRKNVTFVGYGPLEDPAFVVLVKYTNPQNAEWAATSAAPTFSRITKFLFEYYGIVPTVDIHQKPL